MVVKTERLIIRELRFEDEFALFDMCKDPETAFDAGWAPHPSIEVSRNVLLSFMYSNETFAIILKNTRQMIGTISLYRNTIRKDVNAAELGFCLHRDFRKCGYMTEAVQGLIPYAFEKLKLEILSVGHRVGNYASEHVIRKFPFQYEGTVRQYRRLFDGTVIDACLYSMTMEEYWRSIK